MLSDVLSFAVVAGLVTIIPGLDTAMVLRSAIAHGRRTGFATAVGINTGALIWGAGAAVGVSALLTASTVAYTALRIAGAVYIVWMGSRLIAAAVRAGGEQPPDRQTPAEGGALRGWARGLMTNLLNPKIGAFYVAVLPQFIPPHAPHLAFGVLLASVHDLEATVWFTAIILAAHAARAALARRAIDGVSGAALIGFGLKLGLSRR